MTGEVQTGGLLLHRQQFPLGYFRNVRHRNLRVAHLVVAHAEQVHLTLDVLLAVLGNGIYHGIDDFQKLTAVVVHGIERACLDETFKGSAIEFAVVHALAEILERGKQAVRLSLLDKLLHKRASHTLDGCQTEADILARNRKLVIGLVYVRRKHRDTHITRRLNILGDLIRNIQNARQQRRQIFSRVMALEIRRAERYDCVAYGMCLVERVVCEIHDLVKQACRNSFGHAALDGAVNAQLLIAVDEVDALLFQLLHLLFAHGAAHHICLAERVTRKALEHLHDLFLINHTAVGDA